MPVQPATLISLPSHAHVRSEFFAQPGGRPGKFRDGLRPDEDLRRDGVVSFLMVQYRSRPADGHAVVQSGMLRHDICAET